MTRPTQMHNDSRRTMRAGRIAGFSSLDTNAAIGRALPGGQPKTVSELLASVPGFDRTIERRALYYNTVAGGVFPEPVKVDLDNKVVLVERNTEIPLGVHSPRYGVLQDSVALRQLEPLLAEHNGVCVRAALLDNGKKCFAQFRLPGLREEVRPGDVVEPLLTYYNSHDGSTRPMLSEAPFRLFCDNQLAAFRDMGIRFSHRGNVQAKFGAAVNAMQIGFRNRVNMFREFAKKTITWGDIQDFLDRFVGAVDNCAPEVSDRKRQNITDRRTDIERVFENGIETGQGTAWDLLNAATEVECWHPTSRTVEAATVAQITGKTGARIADAVSLIGSML